ncbi:hypothetical protein DCAR_0729501 [Daucus carota subsp. sativus]|uniref:Vacuolar protein sorting-associated protein 13 VPS13 adaptor binding domain-containing protein n=1 Tax=Daucus carota subsp. sativus TaxID=79200 RepID=A0AAF1B8E3_DAUCS|nr:hypothetical protein DCAR_0729501 [Daucus carota subsp. sativus]
MFFNDWLQRKLASVLRPWLRQETELELKLGFLRSHGIAKDICFDTAVLTQQLDDSSRFEFTDFRIDELKLGVSNWSFPAFRIDVNGLHVTLTLRDIRDDARVNEKQRTADRSADNRKKVLSEIDPEGIALNDAMESLSAIICSNSRRTSLLCTILGHGHLRIRHVHLSVQCLTSNNSYKCMLEMTDFDIKSGFIGHRCFLRAVISSLLFPSSENSFKLGVRGLTVGLKDKDSISNIFSSRYLQTFITLRDLHLVNFNLSNPELEFTVSPAQIFIIAAMSKLSTTDSKCPRNGKQLWSIAASRYNSLLPARKWSFQKLVDVVCLWLRYVHAYEHLLSSVGYPVDKMMRRSVIMMSRDKQFSILVKQKWNEISAIEKDLPVEAAVLARRLVRCRVASSVNQFKDISVESLDNNSHTSFFWKILNLLVTVWSYICSTCYSIILLALPRSHYIDHLNDNGQSIASDNDYLQHCFIVNIGIISATIYPEKAVEHSVSRRKSDIGISRRKSDIGISNSNLLSFCFTLDTFYFLYKENIFDQFLSFSCGNLEATSSHVMTDSLDNYDSYLKGLKKKSNDPLLALWGQPAQVFDNSEANSFAFVGGQVEEMWSTWRTSCAELKDGTVLSPEHPFILCEIKNFLTDQGFSDKCSGFKKCCLVIGELNLILEYASIVSIVLILKQIQSALYPSDCSLAANVPPDTPVTCEDPLRRSWDNKYNTCASEMEFELYKLLPHQHIQAAVFIAGPQIKISLNKEEFLVNEAHGKNMHDDIRLVFNIRNVELGVKPTLVSDLESSFWGQDEPPSCPKLKEPELAYSSLPAEETCKCQTRGTLDAHLKVNGLIAHIDTKNQQDQVIVLNPTTIRLSSVRKELHSFGATIVAFSAGLHCITTELAVLIFMDEFSILVKVVDGLTSIFTSTITMFDSNGYMNPDDSGRDEIVQGDSGNTGTLVSGVNWENMIESSTGFVINCTYEIKAIDIVLHKSRDSNYKDHTSDTLGNKKLTMHEVLDCGVSFSIKESRIRISYVARDADILAGFSVLRAGIFNFVSDVAGNYDQFYESNLLLQSMKCEKELSLSGCTFALWLRCLVGDFAFEHVQSSNDAFDCDGEILNLVEGSPLAIDNEESLTLSPNISQKFNSTGQNIGATSSHRMLINISLSEIYFAGSMEKDLLFGEHNLNKLKLSLSLGANGRRISCHTQGGSIFLEAEAVAMFFQCLTSYEQGLRQVFPAAPVPKENLRAGTVKDVVVHNNHHSQGLETTHQTVNQEKVDKLVISLSEISLVLVARDESGILQEILFELDAHLDVKMAERRIFLLRLSRFSIISRILHESIEQQSSEIQISQPSYEMSNHPSSIAEDPTIPISGGPTTAFQQMRGNHSALDEAGSSGHSIAPVESYIDTTRPKVFGLSPQNCILKHTSAYLTLEKFMPRDIYSQQYWFGGGSISGIEITISLQEIQIILSTLETMSGFLSKKATNNVEQKYLIKNQEPERKFEDVVPDGTVVALQDVHHHTYITIQGGQNNYNVVGSIHYSFVEDRALFRVKYHYQRKWGSQVLWISLTSLYAESDSGEPLRLNCRAGSSFVDISSSSDSAWALWKVNPFDAVNYYGDTEVDSYCPLATNMFHLINRKNDCGIAFVDDSFECVSKPGNPFKLKVFQDHALARDIYMLDTHPVEALETGIKEGSESTGNQTCICIEIDKCIVTIVHEISTTKEKIPLLQLSIVCQELLMQILQIKARIMSRLNVVFYYFDGQRNLWSELLYPAELSIFYRCRFQIAGTETVVPSVPVHFYAKIKQLDISMTELSLDILLFVIGELNLAGPFAVKSSVILANCCKVENQSGLTLLCHFHQNQYASIARNQSSMVFLRHLASVSQTSDASIITVQLTDQGSFMTSPVHISLSEAKTFAWRTRIVSSQGSKTYPGPFIVAEVSQRGDELSLAVSPLLRIHNETDFSMELRFQRPEHKESESASIILKAGDAIDDTLAAFGAINLSGGTKKALVSLSVGNYLFSFRPEIAKDLSSLSKLHSVEWSNDLKGGKAVYLSGLFDKLGYKVRKALSAESVKCSFSIAHCSVNFEEGHMGDVDFLIQSIGRDIPVIQPDSTGYTSGNKNSHVALQEQKEIFILPTIQISNLLQSEVEVFLSDKDSQNIISCDKIGKFAIVPCGSTSNLYANPATIYFTFTLTAYKSSCKPVNCADWVKKLQKQKSDVNNLDVELDFGSGKYFALLRLGFKDNGILEAAIFTPYTLKNDTEFHLFCCGPNSKPLPRYEAGNLNSEIPPELGALLPAKSTSSWFIKCNKVCLFLLDGNDSHTVLDLDALSGLTEIDLEVEGSGCRFVTKLGVALKPSVGNVIVPSRTVSINPRYIVSNESEEIIIVQQCYLEDEMQGVITVNGKQRTAVHLRNVTGSKKEIGVFDKFLRHHKSARDDTLLYVQFKPKGAGFDWSGPVCVTSLGRFFLKFKRIKDYPAQDIKNNATTLDHEYSSVHVMEEDSTLVLHFYRPPNTSLPYRIENCLEDAPITYYQKGTSEPEVIRAGGTVNYVWDDSNLPHKLVVQITEVQLLREINLDKLRAWKPFYRAGKQRGLGLQLPLHRNPGHKRSSFGQLNGIEIITSGFEVYADGPTRVLRICEFPDSHKANRSLYSGAKMQLRVFNAAISILEPSKKERDTDELPTYTPIIVIRLGNMDMDSLLTNHRKCNSIRVQSLSVDEKWIGAPFASMIRRHHSQYSDADSSMLHIVFNLLSTSSEVKHVEYSSIVLQPFDLNLDEETLMRIVPFLRTSLSDPHTKSQQYYFDHFEIHPIKIIASFLPGEFYSSYSSTQETLRSLLHSVIKIPAIKQKSVELNGVLVTHAMITIRELSIKCAQHYSWYAMRAIYIAKGSPLLPPAFASIFDDSASSSLDVFFDPSSGLINLPGLTIGTFKLISKSIDSKGFSGTKRYFGDLGKTLKAAGSNILFAATTEISDSILKGAETSGFNGMVSGFHQGVLKLAMEPTLLGTAFIEGGPDRKIKLDRNPGVDELYIEGYLQAMLDAMYKQEYLRVRVIDDQVILKNLPPSSSLIEEIMDRVKGFLVSKTLLKGDSSSYRPLRHVRGESDWKIGPTILTLCEHLFVSFMIRALRKQAGKVTTKIKLKEKLEVTDGKPIADASVGQEHKGKGKVMWRFGIGRFVLSGIIAYLDGRLCRRIPNPIARRIVSGFLLTLLDQNDQ